MSLKETIQEDVKTAMKSRDTAKLSVLRMAFAEIRKREIDTKKDLDDTAIQKALSSMIKQRNDSVEAFKKGDRQDLADKEAAEILVLKAYLPEQLPREEVEAIVRAVIKEVGATTPKEIGKVMQAALAKTGGRADGKVINEIARSLLTAT